MGPLARNPEAAASALTFFMSFLPYLSSAFVPIATMPSWLREWPTTSRSRQVVESVRGLLLDLPVSAHAWQALAWCAGIRCRLRRAVGLPIPPADGLSQRGSGAAVPCWSTCLRWCLKCSWGSGWQPPPGSTRISPS